MTATASSDVASLLHTAGVRGAQVPMACETIEPTLSFFVERLGFRLDAIFPADDPSTAILSGHGLQIRLACGAVGGVGAIELLCATLPDPATGPRVLTAPNGVTISLVAADPPLARPTTRQALVVTHASADDAWVRGRAGLRYRDLLPDRLGGAFIASHIRVLDGGPVPDYVHYHQVRFQAIFCRRGWVRVVYEGQGDAFVMQAGDCVLQPPLIRHRVLESSAGAEVVEIGGPAKHLTMVDHARSLPSAEFEPDRDFGGQRFVRHIAAEATWSPDLRGFDASDTGIGQATAGLAGIRVLRRSGRGDIGDIGDIGDSAGSPVQQHDGEFCFYFVLAGALSAQFGETVADLGEDDSFAVPAGMPYRFMPASDDLQLLEVTLPARARSDSPSSNLAHSTRTGIE